MKKTIILVSLILILGLVSGCKKKENKDDNSSFWDNFYKQNEVTKAYDIKEDANYNKASFGYLYNNTQGLNNWYYLEKNGSSYNEVSYNSSTKSFKNSNVEFKEELVRTSGDSLAARGYKVTRSGDITICGNIRTNETGKATLEIYKNENKIYPSSDKLNINNDTVGFFFETKTKVSDGDYIYFVYTGESYTNPIIYYEDYTEVLYQVPEWNFYGDVHPFYYNGKMYMYNLQAYLEYGDDDARYMWCLHESSDMFNYTETDYVVYPFVKDHYNSTIDVYESIFDKITFPYGSRDMFLFYDHIAKKYVYIGLCYYRDMSSCLGCRVSEDQDGMIWNEPMFSLRDFDYACDPECTQAIFINDRWYILTSIWGQSIHSVGRPAYLIGDKGKAFLDNDWANKEFHYLDGEDLCAAQIVDVGSGHYLMYGWIPKTSYSNTEEVYFDGTRDHGLWGGNINVPREVYQNSDGTLSTRLDSKVETLLSRGKLYYRNSVNSNETLPGEYDRTYVTFDVEMGNATEFTYKMTSNGKDYEISLLKDGNDVLMSISCNQDKKHVIASEQIISNKLNGTYSVELIIDHSIVEFYVDKTYSLTARTSMFKGTHTVSLNSNGNATFKNLTINKLANQDDIYD